jgi:hypothetical protein
VPRAHLNNGAASECERDGTSDNGKLTLTDTAIRTFLELHNGEREILVPLEGLAGGSTHLQSLVESLQAAAQAKHSLLLPRGVAVAALEVARNQQDADGWPMVENTLHYLQRHEKASSQKSADSTGNNAVGHAAPLQASSAPEPAAQAQPPKRNERPRLLR